MDNDPCVCSMSDILQIRAGRITRYSCRALRIKNCHHFTAAGSVPYYRRAVRPGNIVKVLQRLNSGGLMGPVFVCVCVIMNCSPHLKKSKCPC